MNKTALITGASGGIGKSISETLAAEGYNLLLHYNTNQNAAAELAEKLRETFGVHAETLQADLSAPEGADKLTSSIVQPVDAIVLNSGRSHFGLITDVDNATVQEMVQLHVASPYMLTRNLLPGMIRNKSGAIVAVSSIWGETGASCEVLYSMAKGAQHSFVKGLAKELAPSGIRVNAVAPGAVDTNMMNQFTLSEKEEIADEIPIGRLARPQEIADATAFLLSEKASYITGQILSVNGGWHC
ncbi:EF-P-5 aminopentanone reductase [Bacillus spizizenii]|jgi:3-oxoacyl-[acyl-carrier protein] reductase|uniref:EF-P-5 aminopentanone reductase n=1 Tax=Bacillus spizizenii TaxID=96241 RepID=A0A9Q4HFZ2_BACSC|nr:EF-P-5 aminopentanone reductase [Bacillus spizizenii]CUB23271.1 3-oxoacyl-[acyl-carrier-protein] reductase FabG [Bacillus cereus]CUB39905.1 3-oxoacyl-[acyl-carrier-protein] reductase FabG [Bacillus subtilis]KXJ36420.1 3-ketoacyl-ACP reductase [Bacillus spizizenii]MCY8455061.1 EF-P-5 aminopentanone reductase [Bacillus spizizenii]MCY8456494.1 EF-P-5 aminopentanone reductase [Bacillus spizizenii]